MKDWTQVVYLWSDPRIRGLGREARRERKNIQYHIIKLATSQMTDPWTWIGQEYLHVHELPPPPPNDRLHIYGTGEFQQTSYKSIPETSKNRKWGHPVWAEALSEHAWSWSKPSWIQWHDDGSRKSWGWKGMKKCTSYSDHQGRTLCWLMPGWMGELLLWMEGLSEI